MNDIRCGYTGDREAALVAYLYDDLGAEERGVFERHLGTCARCRTEVAAFGGVRRQLAQWTPPAYAVVSRLSGGIGRQLVPSEDGSIASSAEAAPDPASPTTWWRAVPAWAQVAAAMLVLGIAAGIANLDVHYDGQSGLNVRTGSSRPATQANLANPSNLEHQANVANTANFASRDDLASLERQLRDELRAVQQARSASSGTAAAHSGTSNEAEVLRQVKTLIDQSERRQQNELALRLAALATEVNGARQADLRRIDMSLGRFQDSTGVEVLRNRQKLDFLLQRVAQQQQ